CNKSLKFRNATLTSSNTTAVILKPRLVRLMSQDEVDITNFDSGYEGKSEDMPYIVALEFSSNRRAAKVQQWFCAGAIIDRHWIVTVASCSNPASQVKIIYGAGNRLEPSYHIFVSKSSFFPRFDFNKLYHHDIVLIKVPYIKYSSKVNAVRLPVTRNMFRNQWHHSAGWGQHKETKQEMSQMHVMQIEVVSNEYCNKSGYGARIMPEMMCGQLPRAETSCCMDSGSPLVILKPPTLIGIASFGNQLGCKSSTPLVFTRINSYTQWMREVRAANKD
ncbi:hypothetical protein KR044_000193, partial [Drosophila immigrans]